MMNLKELRQRKKIINEIDWAMTPEKAVSMYLEWGTGWKDRRDVVSSDSNESIYFVIYDWEKDPGATLIRRTVEGAEEIARIRVPQQLFDNSWREEGTRPGGAVHPPNKELKEWLHKLVGGPPLDLSIVSN